MNTEKTLIHVDREKINDKLSELKSDADYSKRHLRKLTLKI